MQIEIIISTCKFGAELALTTASLAAQTDREFAVVLGDDSSRPNGNFVDTAERQLVAAGIRVLRVKAPFAMSGLEHFNWMHTQAQADCLKPLLPGEQLAPAYIQRLKQRLAAQPKARMVRCDLALATEWGAEILTAPFQKDALTPAEVLNYFPAHRDWLSRSSNVAYSRSAWLALGGFSPHVPNYAALNFNVLLALHYGLENISETLVSADMALENSLNETRAGRVNHSLEWWLILRQANNYCLAAKLPWTKKCLFLRSLAAALGRSQSRL